MMTAAKIARGLHKAHKNGRGWKACCPAHDDREPSLHFDDGPDGKPLVICRAGCPQEAVVAALKARGLWSDGAAGNGQDKPRRRIVATYDYHGGAGQLVYQVVRYDPKDFRQRRPDPAKCGEWVWNMMGVSPVPYRLPELVASDNRAVLICEGEKDADAVAALGLIATTNHGGAGKWRPDLNGWFKGRTVYVLPHNDKAGRDHVQQVARNLHGIAARVHVVELPGLGDKGDAADWIATGGTAEALQELCQSGPAWQPDAKATITLSGEALGPTPPAFSDEALALRFAGRHCENLRYVAAWGQWFAYRGGRWQPDDTLKAFDIAPGICREAAVARKTNAATGIASAKTVAAVVSLARADRRLATTVSQWDADPWLLNTPAGAIDLRTGARRDHSPTDYFTKMTAVEPGGDCPLWLRFLDRVTGGDVELQSFLQRVVGYSLTGVTREHAMFFAHGTGANGKSVFITTISGLIANYHRNAPIETFTASNSDRHPTDLAGLHGARLVTADETEEGRRWAESKIKALTGGDTISARFMRQDFFEYRPQFKLIIAGNHKPGLRSVDEAIRRRLHLIPFTVTIPEAERDLQLVEKLQAEWPGILKWAIEGCLAWQRVGLATPAVVRDATTQYLENEDAFAAWIDDCCERDPRAWEMTSRLFGSWKVWAERSSEYTGSLKRFREQLHTHRFEFERRRQGKGFRGIALQPEPDTER